MSHPVSIHKRGVRFFIDGDVVCPMTDCPKDWYLQWWKNTYENWEPRTFIVFDTFLDPRRSCIDVGAWIGPTVLYAASQAKHVYCFEPDPEANRVLALNLAVNPQYRNVTVFKAALSNADGETTFGGNGELGNSESTILVSDPDYVRRQGSVLRTDSVEHDEAWRNSATVRVQSVTMETIEKTNDLQDCAFMKIDIEGGEKIVVPAIAPFLRRHRPTLYLSIHWVYLSEAEISGLFDLLSAIYEHIYDDTLMRKLSRGSFLSRKVSSIVCMERDLSLLQALSVRARTADAKMRRGARRAANALWR